jgi:ABC-type uncharacterized transport system substrate-binding protein
MAAQHPRAAAKKRGRELPFSRRPRLLDRNTHMHSYEGLPIEWRWGRGSTDQFPRHAAEVAGLNVDVIVAGNSPAGLAAKNASKTMPIVIATTEDPMQQGFATSLAHAGGSTRGSTSRRRLAAHRPAFRIKLPVS